MNDSDSAKPIDEHSQSTANSVVQEVSASDPS